MHRNKLKHKELTKVFNIEREDRMLMYKNLGYV